MDAAPMEVRAHKRARTGVDADARAQNVARRAEHLLVSGIAARDDDELLSMANTLPDSDWDLVRIDGPFEAALERIRTMKGAAWRPGLMAAALVIIRSAANGQPERLAAMRRQHAIAALGEALAELSRAAAQLIQDSEQLDAWLANVIEALGWLAGDETATGDASANEVVQAEASPVAETLERTMRDFPDLPKLQVIGAGGLGWLRLSPNNEDEEPRRDAAASVLRGLRSHGDGAMTCLALLSFGWLSFAHPPTGALLTKEGAARLMVEAMQRHPLNVRIQYYGCGTISWLVKDASGGATRVIRDAGGVETTIASMRLHPDAGRSLQVAGCMALTGLMISGKAIMQQTVVSLGGTEAILAGMRNHNEDRKVLLASTICLHMLLSGASGAEISHIRFGEAGGCEGLRRAMEWALETATQESGEPDTEKLQLADHILEVILVVGRGGKTEAVSALIEDGAIVPVMKRLLIRSPGDTGFIKSLQQWLTQVFHLNVGPVGWLLYDVEQVRAGLERVVMAHLEDLHGSITPAHAGITLRLIVPVVSGIVRQHRRGEVAALSSVPEAVERHASILCAFACIEPALLHKELRFLVDHPRLLTLEAKRAWLACERQRLEILGRKAVRVETGRTSILNDLCGTLAVEGAANAVGLSVNFRGEAAAGDGLRREWFRLVARELSDPAVNLFASYDGGRTLQPSPTSSVQEGAEGSYFQLAGKVVGLALLHGETLPMRFSGPFLKRILGHVLTPEDVQAVDPDSYKGIQFVLETDDVESLCLTFSEVSDHPADVVLSEDTRGSHAHFDLVPGGSEIEVTEKNKNEYVRLKVEHKLGLLRCRSQIDAFVKGLHEPLPRESLTRFQRMVSVAELDLLIAGLPEINVDDWQAHCAYGGFLKPDHHLAVWFWEVLREDLNQDERATLLHFATGSAAVPATGFKTLSGYMGRPCPFSIEGRTDQDSTHLPTAATCFNRLRLPLYRSRDELRLRLKTALSGVQSFHEGAMGLHPDHGPQPPARAPAANGNGAPAPPADAPAAAPAPTP